MSALAQHLAERWRQGLATGPLFTFIDPLSRQVEAFKPAAVLIPVTERALARPDEPGMLLIHRPATMRAHPGQIAFPGGRCEAGETPEEAALREAEEELGIPASQVQIIGRCDGYRTGTGYEVTPVLAVVPGDLPLMPNPAEVAEWFEAPAGYLLNPANLAEREGEMGGMRRNFYEITWHHHRIWGVTARIIAQLALRLDGHV